jgi:DNA-binding GntR family transcriptional regulator
MSNWNGRKAGTVSRTVDAAYADLLEFLQSGELGPGDRLGEVELAERFGVSRTPVREALQRLAAQGLVEISPNRGARVVSWSLQEMREIYDLRAMLEGKGAEWAATRMAEDQIDQLDRLCDEMESLAERPSPDSAQISRLNTQLHGKVLESAASPRLTSTLAAIVQPPLIVGTFRQYTPEFLARSMSHHRELAAAIRGRDPEWAGNTMRTHILAAKASLRDPGDESDD